MSAYSRRKVQASGLPQSVSGRSALPQNSWHRKRASSAGTSRRRHNHSRLAGLSQTYTIIIRIGSDLSRPWIGRLSYSPQTRRLSISPTVMINPTHRHTLHD